MEKILIFIIGVLAIGCQEGHLKEYFSSTIISSIEGEFINPNVQPNPLNPTSNQSNPVTFKIIDSLQIKIIKDEILNLKRHDGYKCFTKYHISLIMKNGKSIESTMCENAMALSINDKTVYLSGDLNRIFQIFKDSF